MKRELESGVNFLADFIRRNGTLDEEEINEIAQCLRVLLQERYVLHWYEKYPYKGQAYRCIRVRNDEPLDPVFVHLFNKFPKLNVYKLGLPNGFSLWIDPGEVSCRYTISIFI